MTWNDEIYPPQSLRFYFGDKARADDRRLLTSLVDDLQRRRWTVAEPAMVTEDAKAELPTYTIRADRRHDDPSAELRVVADVRWLVDHLVAWTREQRRELEFALDDEEIGWIVQGDIDKDLIRFLDRWERDLRDEADATRRHGPDQSAEGRVSVWLGDLADRAALDALLAGVTAVRPALARELGVGSLDNDTIEAHWAPRRPLHQLLGGLSFGDSFVSAVVDTALGLEITEASTVVVLYGHEHQPDALAATARSRLRFLGVFAYDTAADTLDDAGRPYPEAPAALAAVVEPWRHYYPRLHEYRRATDEQIVQLERSLGATLPSSYREFLFHFGGAHATAGRLATAIADPAWSGGPVGFDGFRGFRRGGQSLALDPHGRIPFDLLPLADTANGDAFCLGIGSRYRDQVWLWSHDVPRSPAPENPAGPWLECLYVVAPTFEGFLAGLQLVDQQAASGTAIAGADHAAAIARSRAVARTTDRVAAASSSSAPTVADHVHAATRSRFGALAARAPELAIALVRGVLTPSDADHADVPDAAAHVVHVLRADSEIRNGGLSQLIRNGGREQLQRSRSALRALGLVRAALILDAADDRVGQEEMHRIDFDDLDAAFYEHDPPLLSLVADFLERRTEPWFERLAGSVDAVRQLAAVTPQKMLEVAIELGAPERVQRALTAGASVHAGLDDGDDPVCLAIRQVHTPSRYAVVARLLDAGAAIDHRDGRERTLLHYAAQEGAPDTVRLLLSRGADATEADTALLHVARCAETTSVLLAAGANPRSLDAGGRTPLHVARDADHVRVLLAAGVNPRVNSTDHQTPLHHAVEPEVIALLADLGVEVDIPDAAGCTPLMFQYSVEAMTALIGRGARVDAVDSEGKSLLHRHHSDSCTQFLVNHGLDPLHCDHAGRNPLDLARASDYFAGRYVALLESAAGIEPPPPPDAPPEPPLATGPLSRIASLLLAHLERDALVELDVVVDQGELLDALADAIAGVAGKGHPGSELARWLVERDEIAEVFGSDKAIGAALRAAVSEATALPSTKR